MTYGLYLTGTAYLDDCVTQITYAVEDNFFIGTIGVDDPIPTAIAGSVLCGGLSRQYSFPASGSFGGYPSDGTGWASAPNPIKVLMSITCG